MPSILEELYYGNIHPDISSYSKNPDYIRAANLRKSNYQKLLNALGESEKELLEKYIEAESEFASILRYSTFTYALKFGALFMSEVFTGINQITGDNEQ